MSKLFPKTHEAFASDNDLLNKIKGLEDRIEQSYQVYQLTQSLLAISDIIDSKPVPKQDFPLPAELVEAMKLLLQDAPAPTQLDRDRDAIWEMRRRAGTQYVLAFLSPNLWMSLEELFAGIVVGYQQMFTSSNRAPLKEKDVFAGQNELKAVHQKIECIRNKHYAHKELEHGRHRVAYFIDEHGAITIDAGGAQTIIHYHLTLCPDLIRCLLAATSYLKQDIKSRSDHIVGNLTEEQKQALRAHAAQA
ncbi:hypothetical protein [Pseudomonas chlororaphis]|uniref:hypothetical protein n=1 Tax=Pseudomonas chlororaphis TaxID=587753 RepID=UPI0006A630D2|nr:hypothetical protein [Pseudomonas chlororaphis]AZD00634.1 hypothetical protein C4K27_1423 [Pseudomonas chlororaphis subsp. chlororaphis]MBM0283467.1 hypothetical protein [Pseudomonas chlororaphis]MDO1503793.1 hypothetical protein [Pseudomonas chlororaphis]ORM48854.1 hypothetical protein B6D51_05165 [Pseudomonas chlororaphis subsp. chlororaphis]TWR95044.1 hypothetical protein FJD36_18530 [Pseudomonas chlororaphis subsp. chlororaphis]